MKKIPTIFIRNPKNLKELLNKPHPDCAWVFRGEGTPTKKYDGMCVLIQDGRYYKRREVKASKPPPIGFTEIEHDKITGKSIGWILVDPMDKADKWHKEAFDKHAPDGTYELCGPKIQGNPEGFDDHILIRHSEALTLCNVPRTYEGLKVWFIGKDIEGIVFHHPDGRMAKIKKKDFGLTRNQ